MREPLFTARAYADSLRECERLFDVAVQKYVYGATLAEIRALPETRDCPECEL